FCGNLIKQHFSLDKRNFVLYNYTPFGPITISKMQITSRRTQSRREAVGRPTTSKRRNKEYEKNTFMKVEDNDLHYAGTVMQRERSMEPRSHNINYQHDNRSE